MVNPQSIHIAENAGVSTPATGVAGQSHLKRLSSSQLRRGQEQRRDYTRRNTASLGYRKQTMDKMKEGFWTAGILQDRTTNRFPIEYALSWASPGDTEW